MRDLASVGEVRLIGKHARIEMSTYTYVPRVRIRGHVYQNLRLSLDGYG